MICAILLMAGKGERLDSSLPKQFIKINGEEVFLYSLKTFLKIDAIDKILLIYPNGYLSLITEALKDINKEKILFSEGGETRQESVKIGLEYLKEKYSNIDKVLIHDSARPLVNEKIINNVINELNTHMAVTPYIKINDAIGESQNACVISSYKDRKNLISIQTPQGFDFNLLYNSHKIATKSYKDDTELVNDISKQDINLVLGDNFNFKITEFSDLILFGKLVKD